MKKLIILIILTIISLFILNIYYSISLKPVNIADKSTKIFVVNKGESVNSIITKLDSQNLIRSRIAFLILVKSLGIENNIQAGDFRLSPSMNSQQIASNLTKGTLDIWVTIIEGMRKEEVAQIIAKKFDIPETEFIKAAPEGYLFPDTYLIPKDASINTILTIFKRNYDNKVDQQIKQQISDKELSEQQTIILASIVEREARSDISRQKVASILLKRWQQNWGLDADATVQYAIGYQPNTKTWWKKYLTVDDLKINSPYNTYKNAGLPPGPICNPSLSSIKAVIAADVNTPYWFYLTSKDGSIMHYAKTTQERQENIEKYLR